MWRRTDRMIPIHLPKTVCVGVINLLPIALFVTVFCVFICQLNQHLNVNKFRFRAMNNFLYKILKSADRKKTQTCLEA